MKNKAIEKLQSYTKQDSFKLVVDYIIERVNNSKNDDAFVKNVCDDRKTIQEMISYILQEAKKKAQNNAAMIEDSEVFGWAVHYFDELDLKVEKTTCANVSTTNVKAVEKSKVVKVVQEPKNKKEPDLYEGATLFDF